MVIAEATDCTVAGLNLHCSTVVTVGGQRPFGGHYEPVFSGFQSGHSCLEQPQLRFYIHGIFCITIKFKIKVNKISFEELFSNNKWHAISQ